MHRKATKLVHFSSIKGLKKTQKVRKVGLKNFRIHLWWATVVPCEPLVETHEEQPKDKLVEKWSSLLNVGFSFQKCHTLYIFV